MALALSCTYCVCPVWPAQAVGVFAKRQERAANAGLIQHLQHFIYSHSKMEQLALQMFCALPYAGKAVRSQLWKVT